MKRMNMQSFTSSARSFAAESGLPLNRLATIAEKLSIPRNGSGKSAAFVFSPESKLKVLDFALAQTTGAVTKSHNQIEAVLVNIRRLCPMANDAILTRAADAALTEHRDSRWSGPTASARPAAERLHNIISQFSR
jgi:hypothetical protein